SAVCAKTVRINRTYKWAIPSVSGMWVCHRSGVTPCVSLKIFDDSIDFCVQVLIAPRVLYHLEEEMYYHWEEDNGRLQKREVLTAVMIATLLGLGIAGTTTGVASLVTQQRGLTQLQIAIDEDLQKIEKSMTSLEQSLSSLSEVVLQNRRGLDLLFMQQGGLCAALKEECCSYADHTGIVRDSMAKLRERLAQRKKEREAQQGWIDSWFNRSPWLTTLISTLIGPIAIFTIAFIFGPCILNRLVSFVKSRLEKVNILLVERR
ncbi:ENV1 protein, partial [Lophotis ruficrista]|nr:ENV1 protein [Lophotis ruficrista]